MSDHSEPAALRFEVLGPLGAWRGDVELDLGPMQRRVVLAVLVLHANKPLGREQLIAAVWGPAAAPEYAVNLAQKHVSALRRTLDPARPARAPSPLLSWTDAGYVLAIPAGRLDLDGYQREVSRARALRAGGDLPAAAAALHGALRRWRGPVCDGLASPLLDAERDRLGEERLTAVEERLELDLALGGHRDLVAELQQLAAGHPMRERLRGLLMLALYRSGRQAEALAVYHDTRRYLRDELGVDPTAQLQHLHQQILAADAAIAAPAETGSVTAGGGIEAGRGLPSTAAAAGGRVPAERRVLADLELFADPEVLAGREVFVGRMGELAVLAAAAAAARGGEPKVVLIEGDAGIGKSTLLVRFTAGLAGATVLRASGDEAELLLPYGIVGQLVAGARGAGGPRRLLASELSDGVDPLAVGAELVGWLGQSPGMVLAVIDDLQWADGPSARALLFAVRRLQADQVLVLLSARTGELSRLGEGWQRFLAGDHRASRVRLAGLGPEDVMALSRALGAGELTRRAATRLLDHTGGNPLYCRAVLEEAGMEGVDRPGGALGVPRSLAGVVLGRVGSLSPAARDLVVAAAVLGHCELAAAAALAGLGDPLPALGEAVTAGILVEQPGGAGGGIGFSHLLVQRAVYGDLSPARRCRLHERAAGLVDRDRALGHRVAAAIGPDDRLADELEAAGGEAHSLGRTAQAAAWLAQAAAVSSEPEAAGRRLLDAVEILVFYGEVAEAEVLAAAVSAAGPGARRSGLLGALDFLAGRAAAAEARLLEAWQTHDPARDASVGAAAATRLAAFYLVTGRIREAIEWGERAAAAGAAPAAVRHQALGALAIALFFDGRGPEGLARLAFLPAAPAEVPREDTDTLVMRGTARVLAEDLAGAIADLSTAAARLRAGVPLRTASLCLSYLAGAEYQLGSWDDAVVHAELAVSLTQDADRMWDLGFVHSVAAVVPALRGDWEVASAHVRMAGEAAQTAGTPAAIAAAATARAFLAMAWGDVEGVVNAAAAVRAAGRAEFVILLGRYHWRSLEIDALIGLGRLDQAETALAELEAALSPAGPPSAMVAAARLRGDLASAAGHQTAAAAAFETARRHAQRLRAPLALALLEISDARHLRTAGQPQAAVARLRSARQRLIILGARPYLEICDRELAAAAAPAGPQTAPALPGLTPAEQAVAHLVATGRSNRQTAAELYVSDKTVEFHLGHIFAKLGIRSRHDLITRIGAPQPRPDANQGPKLGANPGDTGFSGRSR